MDRGTAVRKDLTGRRDGGLAAGPRSWRGRLALTLAVSLALQSLLPTIAEAAISSSGNVLVDTNLRVGNTLAGTRTVDGIGVVDGPFQFITVGVEAGGDGSYVVTNGGSTSSTGTTAIGRLGSGHLIISAGGVFSTTTLAGGNLIVGGTEPGGNGTLSVTGTGTLLSVARQPIVGNGGSGTATFGGGAQVTAPRLLVGISATLGGVTSGGSGTVDIEDVGTLVTLGGQSPFSSGGVFSNNIPVGFGGSGRLNVTGGAKVDMAPNIANHRASIAIGGVNLGLPGDGTMTVSGTGSEVRVRGNSTPGSTLNGSVTIGDGEASGAFATPGTLNVLNGGKLVVEDTPASPASAGMRVGRIAGGAGTLLLSGAGSHVGVAGSFAVGQKFPTDPAAAAHGSGEVTVTDGASLGAVRLRVGDGTVTASAGGQLGSSTAAVGDLAGQVGSLTITGPTSAWTITGPIPPGDSRNFFLVGASGTGTLDVVGGGQLVIDSGPNLGPAGLAGRFAGSVGTINVSGAGSRIEIKGLSDTTVTDPSSGRTFGSGFSVGDLGQGTLNITTGGKVIMSATNVVTGLPENSVNIGRFPGSTGTALVSGAGSELSAQTVRVALDPADVPAGTGVLTVAAGGKVTATGNLKIGPAGTLNGSGGTIVGNVVNLGGTVNPGQSAGRLSIIGDYESVGGKLVVEVDASGNHDVLTVVGTATFDSATAIDVKVDPGFRPTAGASFDVVQVRSTPGGPVRSLLTVNVPPGGGGATTAGPLSGLPTTVSVESVPAAPLSVALDIEPGQAPNLLNVQAEGRLPVAILGSPAFSVTEIDPSTITLTAPMVGLSATTTPALCQVMDVDGDLVPDLLCYLDRAGGETPGDATAVLHASTTGGVPIQGSDALTVVDRALDLTRLNPAKVWIGLKNSDDVGLRVDLLAEVYLGATRVASGQANNIPTGSSGFNNAALQAIPLTLVAGPVPFAGGTQLKLAVSARRTCASGAGHISGTPRLWYGGQPLDSGSRRDAGSRFGTEIDGGTADYFLRPAFSLSPIAGPARQSIDKSIDSRQPCPGRSFTPFGTWTITP